MHNKKNSKSSAGDMRVPRSAARSRLFLCVLCAVIVGAAAACGGGGGGGDSTSATNTGGSGSGGDGDGGGGTGGGDTGGGGTDGGGTDDGGGSSSSKLALAEGESWEFFWTSEETSFAQPNSTDASIDTGRFTITLGPSTLIEGQEAFPVEIAGDPGAFAPRWTHVAAGADGSLLGSTDGAGLETIFDAASETWTGGGMFVDLGSEEIVVSEGQFNGVYNQVPAIVAGRSNSDPRCEEIVGETICDDEATEFSEQEFYKEGIGPIGYKRHIYHEDDGGGFFTSNRLDDTVELIATTLEATDGTVFEEPAWQEISSLAVPREGHAAVAVGDQIWVIGGSDADSNALDSVDIYDPAADEWSAGPSLPEPLFSPAAVAIGEKIYIPLGASGVLEYDPASGWATLTPDNGSPSVFLSEAAHQNDTTFGFGDIIVGVESVSIVDPPSIDFGAYAPGSNLWLSSTQAGLSWAELLRFSVEVVGDETLYVIGGFGQDNNLLTDERGALDTIMELDLTTDAWVTSGAGRLNEARDSPASAVLDGKVYVLGGTPVSCGFGGDCSRGNPRRSAEVYDPASNESTDLPPMFQPRENAAAVAVGGSVYVIGGSDGDEKLGTAERYTPPQ